MSVLGEEVVDPLVLGLGVDGGHVNRLILTTPADAPRQTTTAHQVVQDGWIREDRIGFVCFFLSFFLVRCGSLIFGHLTRSSRIAGKKNYDKDPQNFMNH